MRRKSFADITAYMIYAYLIFMMTAVPLYMKDGYNEIGEAKYWLFFYGTIIFISAVAVSFVIHMMLHVCEHTAWNLADVLMLLFTILTVVSYILSPVSGKSMTGEDGWHMGLLTQLLISAVYFIISFSGKELLENKRLGRITYLISIAVMTFISVIIVMNRFGFRLPGTGESDSTFISTMGNNDWYMGFWSVTSPLAIIVCIVKKNKDRIEQVISYAAVYMSLLSALLQGSESIVLPMVAVSVFLLIISAGQEEYAGEIANVLYIGVGVAATIRVLAIIFPLMLNYYSAVTRFLSRSDIMIVIFIVMTAAVFVSPFICKKKIRPAAARFIARGGIYFIAAISAAAVICIVLIIVNTVTGGIRPIADIAIFRFNDDWGNSRGFIWKISWNAFTDSSFIRKMFGSGPDGFAGYMYGDAGTSQKLFLRFGNARLTNAHNTIMTMLIDNGIAGTSVFVLFFLNLLGKACRDMKKNPILYVCIASLIGYVSCNITGFHTVLNTPYAYIVMGITACVCKCTDGHV